MMTPFSRAIWSIIVKDLRAELRSRELVNSMVLFALLSILIFSFALELDRNTREQVVSGILWVTLVYASTLGLNRSLATERENGGLQAMVIAPVGRTAIYFGKLTGNFLFTLIIGVILLPVMTVLYNITLVHAGMFLLLILGVLGLTSVGTLLAAMTAQTRARETLLPIAMLPVILPVLIICVQVTNNILAGEIEIGWISTLVIIDLIYIILGGLLFEYVIED